MVMPKKISLKNIKKIPPEQRIVLLKKLEEQRKKEIEKVETLLKRSEMEVQKKKEREIEFEEKTRELFERKIIQSPQEELETIIEETQKPEEATSMPVYGVPLEEIRKIYELTTLEIYNGVIELRNKAAQGRISEEDAKRISAYEHQFSSISNVSEAYINNRETRENLQKIKTALEQIKEYTL